LLEVRLLHCAEDFFGRVDNSARLTIYSLCCQLADDPFLDGENKFPYPTPPTFVFKILLHTEFWIIYQNTATRLRVVNIGRENVDRHTWRC